VVTVPKTFRYAGKRGLVAWIAEGDAAGDEPTGDEYVFYLGGGKPDISPGERVYIVCEGRLRGYAPLSSLGGWDARSRRAGSLIRAGGAVAVTIERAPGIPQFIQGFRGFRYRWWERIEEVPFLEWRTP
jgi:hypothetical protein